MECMLSGGIDPVSVAPAFAISADSSEAAVPLANVTMYGTGVPEYASLKLVVAEVPAPSVAVAVNVDAKASGNVKESLKVPSAAAGTSLS
jgi:hypothetical protein